MNPYQRIATATLFVVGLFAVVLAAHMAPTVPVAAAPSVRIVIGSAAPPPPSASVAVLDAPSPVIEPTPTPEVHISATFVPDNRTEGPTSATNIPTRTSSPATRTPATIPGPAASTTTISSCA